MSNNSAAAFMNDLPSANRPNSFVPRKAMYWYDSIIDDMFANPGTSIKDVAARLKRSPVTIGYIVTSDLFKARYAQRRNQFSEELDTRLIGKLAKVAELSLDFTLAALEKKRESVPLPLLHEISDKALARLGYGPKPAGPAAVAVTVNNSNTSAAQVVVPVSAAALAAARDTLKTIEQQKIVDLPLALVDSSASAAEGGGEDGNG